MSLREIPELNDREWNELISEIEKEKTPKEEELLQECIHANDNIPTTTY